MEPKERKQELFKAAERVFAQNGYHATSIEAIIKEAGVARGTFYRYFNSKRAIFAHLVNDYFNRIENRVNRINPQSGKGIRSLMMQNVEGVLNVLLENQHLTKILLNEAVGVDADLNKQLLEFYGNILKYIEGSLKLGITMGVIRECHTEIISCCILGTIKEVLYHYIMTGKTIEPAKLAGEILDYNLKGLFMPGV